MKNKGFTLIELLAVIIILGILMIIAIPSVTTYINNSRKSAYVDTAKEIISGARNLVNEGNLGMYDTSVTYYIPSKYIKTEGGEAESPYGKLEEAYIGVVYDGTGYNYYWVSRDESGQGFKKIISNDSLEEDDIESDIEESYVNDLVHKSAIGCNKKIKILNDNGTWEDYSASEYVIDEKMLKENNTCPNCVFVRPNVAVTEGTELNVTTVNDYRLIENYSTIPFMGITLNGNIIDTLHVCFVAGDNLVCLDSLFEGDNFDCQSAIVAKGLGIENPKSTPSEYTAASNACRGLYYTYSSNLSVPGSLCKSEKYGYETAYAKGSFINFFGSNNYVCVLQTLVSNPTDKEWGTCNQF